LKGAGPTADELSTAVESCTSWRDVIKKLPKPAAPRGKKASVAGHLPERDLRVSQERTTNRKIVCHATW